MLPPDIQKNVRFNFVVNVLDGVFFGFGFGFVYFYTFIPLFLSTLTGSTLLISLVTQFHTVGWQLPQLFVAGHVAGLTRYKRMVMFMTVHERWPFIALALVALAIPALGKEIALVLALILLAWHSLAGGLASAPWQSMIGKIMPANRRGTFWGVQGAAANLMIGGGSVMAGVLIERLPSPLNFALCFVIAGLLMAVSMAFLGATREPENARPKPLERKRWISRDQIKAILENDRDFRWFVIARMLAQLASMAGAFYTLYAIRRFDAGPEVVGALGGVYALAQTVSNPLLGWIGDRWGHRRVIAFGAMMLTAAPSVAILAPDLNWLYITFAFAGFANAVFWTIIMAMTLEFGDEAERPLYIGMTNTLIAPVTIAAPILGSWLADTFGFSATLLVSALCGLLAALIIGVVVRDPGPARLKAVMPPAVESTSLDLAA